MAIDCWERLGSRRTTSDESLNTVSVNSVWMLTGSNDEIAIRQKLLSTAPPIYFDPITGRTAWRKTHDIDQTGPQTWEATVSYDPRDIRRVAFSFDTTGGTAHVTQSRGTRAYGDSPPDFRGAIGVRKDSIEGVDIVVPALKFSETHLIPSALITQGWVDSMSGLTGNTNLHEWRSYAAERVLFMGITGQSQDDGLTPVTFSFEVGQHLTSEVGGIPDVEKKAWEYLWASYEETADDDVKKLLQKPKWVFVEQVYGITPFSNLGI